VYADCASGTVYAGTGDDTGGQNQPGALYKSTDGGQTFSVLPTPACNGLCAVQALAVSPSNPDDVVIAQGQQGTVNVSSNGGMTWTNVNNPPSSGFDFSMLGIVDLEAPTSPYSLSPSNDGLLRLHAITAGDVLIGSGGGEYAAPILPTTPPVTTTAAAPRITSFSISPKRFAVSRKATAVSARKHQGKPKIALGATFKYGLSIAASVQLSIEQALRGAREHRRCVAVTRKIARHHYVHCTRYRLAGTLSRNGSSGTDKLAFSGRIGRRALASGSYKATILATANHRLSTTRSTSFTIEK
jgi:hypothetical protein